VVLPSRKEHCSEVAVVEQNPEKALGPIKPSAALKVVPSDGLEITTTAPPE
jgi:hypothetical protein